MTKYNKYEIYVDDIELSKYIEDNSIGDLCIFKNGFKDFHYVQNDERSVNFSLRNTL